ncbi:hypothetical protein V8E51_014678 [Hyaloscypha variabilis]
MHDGTGSITCLQPTNSLTCAQNPEPQRTEGLGPKQAEQEVNRKALKCEFPDCTDGGEFSTDSALRKHQDKHSKPYTCLVLACRHPQFGDKGGLDRHAREVHGSKAYCCPITTCKRHTRGFPRKYNLFEHQKRCHPGQSLGTTTAAVSGVEGFQKAQDGEEEASSPESVDIAKLAGVETRRVHEKLRALLAKRVELDKDIEALRRTVDILDDVIA